MVRRACRNQDVVRRPRLIEHAGPDEIPLPHISQIGADRNKSIRGRCGRSGRGGRFGGTAAGGHNMGVRWVFVSASDIQVHDDFES